MTLPEVSGAPPDVEALTFPPKVASRVWAAIVPSALVICVAVLAATEPRQWVAWVVLLIQLPMAVTRWLIVREARRQPWALRVNAAGVWWHPQGPPLPWASVANIEVHQARGLRWLLPHRRRVLLVSHAEAEFARRAKSRPVGRSILLDQVGATPEAVVAAFRVFTDAPSRFRLD